MISSPHVYWQKTTSAEITCWYIKSTQLATICNWHRRHHNILSPLCLGCFVYNQCFVTEHYHQPNGQYQCYHDICFIPSPLSLSYIRKYKYSILTFVWISYVCYDDSIKRYVLPIIKLLNAGDVVYRRGTWQLWQPRYFPFSWGFNDKFKQLTFKVTGYLSLIGILLQWILHSLFVQRYDLSGLFSNFVPHSVCGLTIKILCRCYQKVRKLSCSNRIIS